MDPIGTFANNPALWPTILSALAAVISSSAALSTRVTTYRAEENRKVTSALDALLSSDIATARNEVGAAARTDAPLDPAAQKRFVDAAFRVMWAIQKAAFARQTIRKSALAVPEAQWLYRQLDIVVADLNEALRRHGASFNWQPTLDYTNEVLTGLPKKIRNEWSLTVGTKTFTLLEVPTPLPELATPPHDAAEPETSDEPPASP